MQYLYNQALDYVRLHHGFFSRGEVFTYDFSIGDFTIDTNWHPIDFSSIVPASCKLVFFCIRMRRTITGGKIMFRKHGYVSDFSVSARSPHPPNTTRFYSMFVELDDDLCADYFITATGWTIIDIVVRGWWL